MDEHGSFPCVNVPGGRLVFFLGDSGVAVLVLFEGSFVGGFGALLVVWFVGCHFCDGEVTQVTL